MGLTAWSPDGRDLVVTAAAELVPDPGGARTLPGDDEELTSPLSGALVGERGDLVAVIRDRVLELSPAGRLDPGVARDLRAWRQLTIPDEAVPEFCGEFLPGLIDAFPVVDRVGRLELPELDRVEWELVIRRYAGPDSADGPDLVAEWFRLDVLRMSDGTEPVRRRPVTPADLGETGAAPADPESLRLVAGIEEAGWGWVLEPGQRRVTGHDAAVLLADGVPVLRALGGVRVTVREGVPEIRRADEGPRISVAAEDEKSGIDWLGLSVGVTVEGRPVPFRVVFRAVVSGQTEFVTDDGVLVPVDLERFGELRTLLEEALAASTARAGRAADPDPGDLRIGLGQAGLWADLAELADDLAPPTGRAAALLELASDTPEPVAVPAALQAELRPYQQQGLDWLAMLWRHRVGGILADDMGLGKPSSRWP